MLKVTAPQPIEVVHLQRKPSADGGGECIRAFKRAIAMLVKKDGLENGATVVPTSTLLHNLCEMCGDSCLDDCVNRNSSNMFSNHHANPAPLLQPLLCR